MATPVIPNPVLILYPNFSIPEGSFTTIIYFETASPITNAAGLAATVDAFSTSFATVINPCLSTACTYLGTRAVYENGTGQMEYFTNVGSGSGTSGDNPLPIQDCFEVRKVTGLRGRSKRGRNFFSGLSEDDVTNGQLNDGNIASFQALQSFMGADVTASSNTLHWRHWDRKNNVLVPITAAVCIDRLVSRRDRAKKEKYLPIG